MKIFSNMIVLFIVVTFTVNAQNQFIGAQPCGMCHKNADQGEQLKIWQESAHANAYKTLLTEESDKIAADLGHSTKAAETEACLKCHASGYNAEASLLGKRFKIEDGVQCETCHGAGSEYKSKKIMEDHAKSVAAGMVDFSDPGSIEKQCITCHNEESPTYKPFDFEKKWPEIAHPVPPKG